MKRHPLLICMSSTRNYGWVTRAFCEANSRWADYIIIVDQMSTDDTRAICAEYEKVIIVDDPDLSYSETRRSTMALKRARQIEGDKILIYLAIDEVLPANWMDTNDGQRILNSVPTDMFQLNWANLMPDKKHYRTVSSGEMYRVFHDDNITLYYNQNKDMHTHCLPYHFGGAEYDVLDFPILHFGYYNVMFQYVKLRYYQMVDYDKNPRSAVTLSRFYNFDVNYQYQVDDLDNSPAWFWEDFDIFSLVNINIPITLLEDCKKFIDANGIEKYIKLDIWDDVMLRELQMEDPRPLWARLFHAYLRVTAPYKKTVLVRAIDKLLKQII